MQYSEEWKSLFPISSVHSSPLLAQNSSSLGPLFFNPVPESSSVLFSSFNLSPHVLPPPPNLSLPRFLETSTSHDSIIPPTVASSVSASFDSKDHCTSSDIFLHNRLEPLYCPNNQVFVFFPTGSNLNCVGFFVISVSDSKLVVDFTSEGSVLAPHVKLDHRIVQLSACSLSDCSIPDVGGSACVGFLLACNMYAVNWFSVQISGHCLNSKAPALVLMGSKKFTSGMVAHACWNPHMPGECVLLLESGALFLFDMNSCLDMRFKGKRINVAWHELDESAASGWFSFDFTWHPRILVVANSKAIYMVDLRFGKCQPSCLLKIDILGASELSVKDKFVVFSKAGSGGFLYTVASEQWLFLCDVRKPLMPVLKWAHHLHMPRYMNVMSLSDLRSIPRDKHAEASAIILGSFWNNEFSLFCFGRYPTTTKSLSREIAKFSNSFYAWELPSSFLLDGKNCHCGSCLLRKEIAKDDHPAWMNWQQKWDLVLGFCILDKGLSSLLPQDGEHGGFTLIRLMSSGKLEYQQYRASWKMEKTVATGHGEVTPLKDSLLCSMGDEEYEFARKFRYIKLENLYNHLNNNLAKLLFSEFRNIPASVDVKSTSNERFHKFVSEKLKSVGCDPPMSHLSVADIFKDVNMPTSLYEIVSRLMWASLPVNILEVAFPDFSEALGVDQKKASLEFPAIPDQNQQPPFFFRNPTNCSNKGSSKVRSSEDFVGPVCPLPALVVLKEISRRGYSFVDDVNEFSPEDIYTRQCKHIFSLTKEWCLHNDGDIQDEEHAVSLTVDRDETWVDSSEMRSLFMYEPSAFSDELEEHKDSVLGERYDTIIGKIAEDDGDFFSGLCPMELKYDTDNIQKSTEKSNELIILKKQLSHWQNGFMPYQKLKKRLQEKQHPSP